MKGNSLLASLQKVIQIIHPRESLAFSSWEWEECEREEAVFYATGTMSRDGLIALERGGGVPDCEGKQLVGHNLGGVGKEQSEIGLAITQDNGRGLLLSKPISPVRITRDCKECRGGDMYFKSYYIFSSRFVFPNLPFFQRSRLTAPIRDESSPALCLHTEYHVRCGPERHCERSCDNLFRYDNHRYQCRVRRLSLDEERLVGFCFHFVGQYIYWLLWRSSINVCITVTWIVG